MTYTPRTQISSKGVAINQKKPEDTLGTEWSNIILCNKLLQIVTNSIFNNKYKHFKSVREITDLYKIM